MISSKARIYGEGEEGATVHPRSWLLQRPESKSQMSNSLKFGLCHGFSGGQRIKLRWATVYKLDFAVAKNVWWVLLTGA